MARKSSYYTKPATRYHACDVYLHVIDVIRAVVHVLHWMVECVTQRQISRPHSPSFRLNVSDITEPAGNHVNHNTSGFIRHC